MRMTSNSLPLAFTLFCVASKAFAAEPAPQPILVAALDESPEIVVFGRGEKRIGIATQATEGGIAGADLSVRPILRIGELLEAVPGLIATQHAGGGKANQYFLRGFNLDHGTDFTLSFDDVPLNMRTHAHGQGYLDLNSMIPETIARIDYRKGPYRADVGDFALAGAAQATTVDTLQPFVSLQAGSYDFYRFVAGGSFKLGNGNLLLATEIKRNNGKWDYAERLRHYSGFAKYSQEIGDGTLRLSASIYSADWRPTEQIPERAIGTILSSPYDSLDRTLNGKTDRQIFTARYDTDDLRVSAYFQHYDFNLFQNYTFFLDDPVNGDQLEQSERRNVFGGRVEKKFTLAPGLSLLAGFEGRHDAIGEVGLYHGLAGVRDFARNVFQVDESSAALYAEVNWQATERLGLFAGLRGDTYRFKTRAIEGEAWSGKVNDSQISPKLGASYRLADGIAIYANYGRGFHSNDARGVTNPDSPAPGLVNGTGSEIGLRVERGSFIGTATYWWLTTQSELIYAGDAGTVEPSSGGRRRGYEITGFWRPVPWLALDAVWTNSRGRLVDSPGADFIPNALESAGELGASAIFDKWNASMRVRHLGPSALIEDNSVRGATTTLLNFRVAFTPARYEVFAELLNALDSRRKDIQYFYTTRLPGEPSEGIDGVNSRVVEPRMFRIGAKYF